MKVQHKTEIAVLIIGGVLLLLHGIHGVVTAIAYFAAPAGHVVSLSGPGFAASEAAGYAAGTAAGHVIWPVLSLCFGIALLWLAVGKRVRHTRSASAA